METNLMRFLEISAQTFALASVWRSASSMVTPGTMINEPLALLPMLESLTIPATLLAVIGSVAVTHIGIRGWRKLRRAINKERSDLPAPISQSPSSSNRQDRLVADLQNQIIQLHKEKEALAQVIEEKSASLRQDTLTGIANRLAYEEQLQQEFLRWKRFGNPLTLLIWDIDRFKQINDSHGHAAGDDALRNLAQQLAVRLRNTDFVARYGGEEFAMLLPGADVPAALRLADEIRSQIAEAGFIQGENRFPMTISCGLAGFEAGDTPQEVFKRADQALYQAKRAGRNCCRAALL